VGGIVTRVKRMKIKSGPNAGKVMARFVLEDLKGGVNVAVFADALRKFDAQLVEDAAVVVGGTVRERGGEVELTLERLTPLEKASTRLISELRIDLPSDASKGSLLRLRDLLAEHPGDARIVFTMATAGGPPVEIVPLPRFRVDVSPELEQQIERIVGAGRVARVGA
jgi:DNA polymerase-3 subunit alpha